MIDGNRLGAVGLERLGTPYGQMDCQAFVEWCLAQCGLRKDLAGSHALENARKIQAFLFLDGAGFPRTVLRKAGMYPVPEPPEPMFLHEPEGSLWRRADLTVSLLAENPDRLLQTDDATTQFMNAFSAVLIGYTNRGILATSVWRGVNVGSIQAGNYIGNGFAL